MAGKARDDHSPRTNTVVQFCLTEFERDILRAYAKAKHGGKISVATRALLVPLLMQCVKANGEAPSAVKEAVAVQ